MRRVAIVHNAGFGSRRDRRAAVGRMTTALHRRGLGVDVYQTSAPGDATRVSREALRMGARTILVHGGDGTVNEAAQPLVGEDVPIAVWPGGTGNALAVELGLPRRIDEVADMIVAGKVRRVAVGCAGARHFLLMAGVGLDAALIRAMSSGLKRVMGRGGYWISGLHRMLSWRPRPFVLTADGREHRATFAVIANAAAYGSGLRFVPDASMESPHLDVCLFDWPGRLEFFRRIPAVLAGRHLALPGVTTVRLCGGAATGDDQTWVHADGELLGPLPMAFETRPASLSIIVP